MDWVAQTITAFGQDIGVPDLALGPDNRLTLEMQSGGALEIIYVPEVPAGHVVVVRSKPLDRDASRVAAKALRLADFRQAAEWPVQAGLRDNHLLLSTRIPERAFVLNTLQQALVELQKLHGRIAETN
jgi:type III secretion system chaperone SycN